MAQRFQPTVYLLASRRNGTLYAGVTSDLIKRIGEHRDGLIEGFTKDYGVSRLVWFEQHATMDASILREKDQEMEARMEDQFHSRAECRLARSGGRSGLRNVATDPVTTALNDGDGFLPPQE